MNSNKDSKRNEWHISNYEYANWFILIPNPKSRDDMYRLLNFYRQLDILSRDNRIYIIDEIEGVFKRTDDFYYIDWIEQEFHQRQVIEPPGTGSYVGPSGNPEDFPTQTILTEICFYDKYGNIHTEQISNIRKVLQETIDNSGLETWEIDKAIFDPNIHVLDISPIKIFGDSIRMEKISVTSQGYIDIVISCETNIWFPWVPDRDGMPYDNRDLANCHTPRLNNFLLGVKNLTLDIGGTFEPDSEYHFYDKQLSEHGIQLNIERPE